MSPMDEFRWFQPPRLTPVVVPASTAVKLVDFDIHRVAISFGSNAVLASTVFIAPATSVSSGIGIPINTSTGELRYLQREFGNLVPLAWFANNPSLNPATILVAEVLLLEWPNVGDNDVSEQDRFRQIRSSNFPSSSKQLAQALINNLLSAAYGQGESDE